MPQAQLLLYGFGPEARFEGGIAVAATTLAELSADVLAVAGAGGDKSQ